jgi:hypothetical protein
VSLGQHQATSTSTARAPAGACKFEFTLGPLTSTTRFIFYGVPFRRIQWFDRGGGCFSVDILSSYGMDTRAALQVPNPTSPPFPGRLGIDSSSIGINMAPRSPSARSAVSAFASPSASTSDGDYEDAIASGASPRSMEPNLKKQRSLRPGEVGSGLGARQSMAAIFAPGVAAPISSVMRGGRLSVENVIEGKRARRPVSKALDASTLSSREQADLQVALHNSLSTQHGMRHGLVIPEAIVYYPSEAEFADPLQYIKSIQPEAETYGICKIVPPSSWRPPFALDTVRFKFQTRKQLIHRLHEGTGTRLRFEILVCRTLRGSGCVCRAEFLVLQSVRIRVVRNDVTQLFRVRHGSPLDHG